jgi:subtilisin-like proprotein convertase family protein
VTSPITVNGCDGPPSATSAVTVNIRHTYIGDLAVTLLAPDGTGYVLHNRSGGTTDNISQTYTVDLSSETANGTWTLQVRDAATLDSGALEGWKLSL